MNEEQQELIFDLLSKKAVYGLDDAEQRHLDAIASTTLVDEFHSFEMTAAAISIIGLQTEEPLPPYLFSKIAGDAEKYVGAGSVAEPVAETPWPPAYKNIEIEDDGGRSSWLGWFGWAVAAAACIALAVNIWITPFTMVEQAKNTPQPVDIPQILTPAQLREEMLRSTSGMIKATWGAGNVKELKDLSGDVVWSDEKQAGYMRFKGLPVNDAKTSTYQLWIFDKTQDKATPIDGGTFDVSANGEVVIPINAKLKAAGPEMFAITVEKPGGVVVSKREKIAALAKVETPTA
ncbi:hypothetical protein BH10ACI2_BH10ACI2_17490 [soil metagenome]